MANPQLEDGYTKIANEILERFAITPLASNQWRVLLFIIRKTYGFQKKMDYLANTQIVEGTGLCKAVVSRCISHLLSMNMIIKNGRHIGVQKDWEQWKLAESSTKVSNSVNKVGGEKLAIPSTKLAESSTKVSSCAVTQKKKDNIQKKEHYGEFRNVLLTDEELTKLRERFSDYQERIERLSEYLAAKGKRYASHYAVILNWARRDAPVSGSSGYKVVN